MSGRRTAAVSPDIRDERLGIFIIASSQLEGWVVGGKPGVRWGARGGGAGAAAHSAASGAAMWCL